MKRIPLFLSLIIAFFAIFSTPVSAQNNTYCVGCDELPESTGSLMLQDESKDILFSSDEFINLEVENQINRNMIKVYAYDDVPSMSIVHVPVNPRDGLIFVQYVIDHTNQNVIEERKTNFERVDTDNADFQVYSNGTELSNLSVAEDSITNNITGVTYTLEEYQEKYGDIEYQDFDCEQLASLISTVANSAACYGLCAALGFVTGPGGLTCTVLCAAYAGIPAYQIVEDICG